MRKKLLYQLFGIAIWSVSIFLTIMWYDYRLFVILFLSAWANNISQRRV